MAQTEKKISYKKNKKNFQPNVITNSRQEMNVYERRLFAIILNQIDYKDRIEEGCSLIFEIPINDVSNEKNRIIPYDDLKKTVEALQNKKIFKEYEELKEFSSYVVFPNIDYNIAGNGKIIIELNHKLVPYFIELGKQYISYDLDTYLSLSSVFSQRLYELILMYALRQKPKSKPFCISVSYLQSRLQCNYPNFAHLKMRVLEPVKKELLAKTGLAFEYTTSKKEGKKVVELEFIINSGLENIKDNFSSYETVETEGKGENRANFKTSLEWFNSQMLENQTAITQQALSGYKLSKTQKEKVLASQNLKQKFVETHLKITAGLLDAENPTAYMAAALGFSKK